MLWVFKGDKGSYPASLGYKDMRTIMIYTHVLAQGGKGVGSPLD